MKVKYKFDHIYSEADNLILKAYGVEIAKFAKSDFGENWEGLKEKTFELNPYLVGDIDKLTITGNEENVLPCNKEKEKKLWKDYAADKIDFSMLEARKEELDNLDVVHLSYLSNDNCIVSSFFNSDLCYNKIPNILKNGEALLDFSNIKACYSDYCDRFGSTYNTLLSIFFENFKNRITKLPIFTDLSNFDKEKYPSLVFEGFNNLEDLLQFSNKKIDYIFLGNDYKIEDLSFLILKTVKAFNLLNCKNLKYIPDEITFSNDFSGNITFEGCENLKKINKLVLNNNTFATLNFNTNNDLFIKNIIINKNLRNDGSSSNKDSKCLLSKLKKDGKKLEIEHLQIPVFLPFDIDEDIPKTTSIGVVTAVPESTDALIENTLKGKYYIECSRDPYTSTKFFSPLNIKAFPLNYINYFVDSFGGINIPVSTLEDDDRIVWCDYVKTPNKNFKNILEVYIDKEITVNTLKKVEENLTVEIPLPIKVSDEYPYEFKLNKIIATYLRFSKETNDPNQEFYVTNSNFKSTNNDDNISLTFDKVSNVIDNKEVVFKVTGVRIYNATIDGYEFNGKENINFKVKIIFNLDEQVTPSFTFEDDEGNELNLPLNNPAE